MYFFRHGFFKVGSGFPLPNINANIPMKNNQVHHLKAHKISMKSKQNIVGIKIENATLDTLQR